jgi:hypothetical protein
MKQPRVVVKVFRTQPFCGLGLEWLGRLQRDHEQAIYARLAGIEGVPRFISTIGASGIAIEYLDALPLDQTPRIPPGYFDDLRRIFNEVHARGVAYVDANKRSNILVDQGGKAALIDFQIAFRRRDDWPWPLRWAIARLVDYFQGRDLYHLYKHKRRLAPAEMTEQEEQLSRRRSGLHWLHRKLTKPYRAIRRRFLNRQFRHGRLVSPTQRLEDQPMPEKDSWRK